METFQKSFNRHGERLQCLDLCNPSTWVYSLNSSFIWVREDGFKSNLVIPVLQGMIDRLYWWTESSKRPNVSHNSWHFRTGRKKAAEEAALNRVREQRRQERKQARIAKVQAKRAEIAAMASQAPKEPMPAVHTVEAAPGFPILSPEQYRIYLVCHFPIPDCHIFSQIGCIVSVLVQAYLMQSSSILGTDSSC